MFNREKLQKLSDALHNPLVLPDFRFDMSITDTCVGGFGALLESYPSYDSCVTDIMGPFSRERMWVVSGLWKWADDTREGAALRIDYLLENGVPEDFDPHDLSTYKTIYK